MYKVQELSNYIIWKCNEDSEPINNIYLNYILFYIQRYFLSIGKIAFKETFFLRESGPVIIDIYNKYCVFGADPIFLIDKKDYSNFLNQEDAFVNYIIEETSKKKIWDIRKDLEEKTNIFKKENNKIISNKQIKGKE